MRHSKSLSTFLATFVLGAAAWAQTPRIVYPQANQDVRGEVTMRFEGIPAGGYAIVKIDGQFKQASAQEFVVFDTIADRASFPRGDGAYKVEIEILNAAGGRIGRDEVTFNVANGKVDEGGEAVRLVHWTEQDRINNNVLRFRVLAESNAIIEDGTAAGGGAAAGGGGEVGGSGGAGYLPAPLDYQVTALMRRMVRDVGLYNNSANISTTVAESFERGREGGGTGAGTESAAPTTPKRTRPGAAAVSSVPVKGPWLPEWTKAAETGKYFIKTIEKNGTEINATRKAPTIAIADLLPTFVDAPVRPGSTWYTTMVILGDLTSRQGVNVRAPITFTSYENIVTPAGEARRCAKLEARFRLPDEIAKRIAVNLGNKVGTGAGAGGGAAGGAMSAMGGEAGAEATGLTEADIDVARTDVARVLWFDMDRRQIVRSEDVIRSYFEIPPAADATGGAGMAAAPAMGGMAGGEAAAPAEPQKINYNLNVTTWLDDRVPPPNNVYNGGLGTAHSRDSVTEPGLSRLRRTP